MMHFTCDLCGQVIHPQEDQRYVVKIDVFPSGNPAQLTDADLQDDHMEEVSAILQQIEEGQALDLPAPTQHFRFDLCCECHKKFVRRPLGRESANKLSFSQN